MAPVRNGEKWFPSLRAVYFTDRTLVEFLEPSKITGLVNKVAKQRAPRVWKPAKALGRIRSHQGIARFVTRTTARAFKDVPGTSREVGGVAEQKFGGRFANRCANRVRVANRLTTGCDHIGWCATRSLRNTVRRSGFSGKSGNASRNCPIALALTRAKVHLYPSFALVSQSTAASLSRI